MMLSTPQAQNNINILIVDDRPENLLVLEEILLQDNRNFFKATSGNQALKWVLDKNIGLVLLDVQMPEMDGFEVASLLKANPNTSDIPIIFITALSKEEHYIVKGLETGAIDYLTKPLNADIVRAKVKVFEELWLTREQQKNQLAELKRLNTELTAVNKQKDYLLGMASHDLRNPVAAISQICDLIFPEIEADVSPQNFEMLQYIKKSSDYMLTLLSDLLDVAKIQSGKLVIHPKRININDYAENICKLNQFIAGRKNIQIELEKDFKQAEVFFDGVRIEQVVNNLISNAIKFSPADSRIVLRFYADASLLRVSVKDEGPGIPEQEQAKLFQAFQRLSVQPTGGEKSTGLGLAISYSIVKQHNGELQVNSAPGKGSEFYFSIPVGG